MNRNLFLSILAMDSYNRGYGEGIAGLGRPSFDENGNPTSIIQLGNAVIARDSSSLKDVNQNRLDIPTGFYALAYNWNGETVISYRGTDKANPLVPTSDFWNGWTLGAGFDEASQGGLALRFYKAVTGKDAVSGNNSNVITTGHSLGGGLAGFVANENTPVGMAA
jgi:hypothetical protein